MKRFAFILACLFLLQAFSPVVCYAGCDDMKAMSYLSPDEGKMPDCCKMDHRREKASVSETPLPCPDAKSCCTPACAVPLFTCYYEETSSFTCNTVSVKINGTLPSNNGTPHAGFCADCFQPPEID